MDLKQFKELSETIEAFSKCIALLIGGFWVYRKYIKTRENCPKIQFDVDLNYLGQQDNKILIEIIARMENKGLVRHWINDLTFNIFILETNDKVEFGREKINYQLAFKKHYPDADRANSRIVVIPPNFGDSFVDPGVCQQYTYLSAIPKDNNMAGTSSGPILLG